ncbi:GNAT family N-acetyltransferase [Actinomyces sp. W5033]|uniref:GNAT family N-acetyltransferase n=1 Tax=Actinomyces sp. W5033 TaxID=3446479 RepID=UPI003EE2425E
MRIRPATRDDLPVLRDLSIETFCQTFAHLYDPEDLKSFLAGTYSDAALCALLDDPANLFLLCEDTEEGVSTAVGYVLAGPCDLEHEQVRPGDGEIKRLYLRRTHQGGGRGAALMSAAMQWLLAEGPRTLWLGVWENNVGAQRFYQRFGFEEVGDHVFLVGTHEDRDLIYRRPAVGHP